MFEWVSVVYSTAFILFTTIVERSCVMVPLTALTPIIQLSTYPKYFPFIHHSLPWFKRAKVALVLETDKGEIHGFPPSPDRLEIRRGLLNFMRNVVAVVAVIEPLLLAIVHLISMSSTGDLLDAEFGTEPPSPISPVYSDESYEKSKDIARVESETKVEKEPELHEAPRTRKDAIFGSTSASASTSVIPDGHASDVLKRSKSNADLGTLLATGSSDVLKSTGHQSSHKAERKSGNDCLLRKLGRNRINRKFQEIRDLYPLLNLCQTANHRAITQPRRRKSDEDLTFLENMHKVLRTLSEEYNRPQSQYRVERIVTVPSLLDVAESEEKFLKATLDIVADFETAYDGDASSWRKSIIQMDSATTSKTPKDAWITWGLARNPLLADAVRQEFSRVVEETKVLATGPAVIELPYFTAVVKEGLRRRTVLNDPIAERGYSDFSVLAQKEEYPNPRMYDPTRWLPENTLGLSGMNRRTSSTWDGTCSYPKSRKSFSEIQIFAVTPSIVRRAQAVSTGTVGEDDSSLIAIDLLVITPNPRKPRLVPTLPGRGLCLL